MGTRMMDGTKLLWHMQRVIDHFDKGERVAPIHIDAGISKFCNVSCVYCFGIFQNMKKEYIKRDALLRFMRDAGEIGVKSIGFIGDGEPLCNPHVYEALVEGANAGVSMALSTNGVELDTDEKIETVLDCCSWMRFCLSAGDREGYKKMHRVDKFDTLVKNIRRIVELKAKGNYPCDIGLQAVYVPELMDDDMVKEARLAVDLGVDYFVIKQCSLPEGNKSVGKISFDVKEYDSDRTIDALKAAQSYTTDRTKIIPKYETMARKGARLYKHCPAVPLISEMSGNGDWFPCGYFFGNKREYLPYKFGNIHEMGLKQIWESDRYWEVVRYFREEFDSDNECVGSCRLDACNKFIADYLDKPRGFNFI